MKEYKLLPEFFVFTVQLQVKDLDNLNRSTNLRIHEVHESVIQLMPAVSKLFHNLLFEIPLSSFAYDRIHRALFSPNHLHARPLGT